MNYDFIGDVHGHADVLILLLKKMGYRLKDGTYFHPGRIAIFVGDLVDRGDKVLQTLSIVRGMCDAGNAMVVMGNHEYNTLCYLTKNSNGDYLRSHSPRKYNQIKETLASFDSNKALADSHISWIRNLPLLIETDTFRVIHAFWSKSQVAYVRSCLGNDCVMTDEFFQQSAINGTKEYNAIEDLLKGKEISLPEGYYLNDVVGTKRKNIRVKWWQTYDELPTYANISVLFRDVLPNIEVDKKEFDAIEFYGKGERPVFFGHYWMSGTPKLRSSNAVCVDYSVAKNCKMAAYRWDGEQELKDSSFVWVDV